MMSELDTYEAIFGLAHEPYAHELVGDLAVYKRLYSETHRPPRERLCGVN
jgi:hypothetical protein